MRHSRSKAIAITLAGTLALYAGFAILMSLEPALLAPFANPHYPGLSRMFLPIGRGVLDFMYACGVALVIYVSYRLLACAGGFRSRRIARTAADAGQIGREVLLALNFALATGVQATVYLILGQLGLLKIYASIGDRGWPYAILSLLLFVVLSDAWFYSCHRFYHQNRLVFRNIHAVHHLSVVTTPMTNTQISPWELLPSALFAMAFLMIVPMAMPVLSFLVIASSLYLILLHSGYEIFPRGTAEHWLGKWLVTPTYHQMHHELFTKHMGLYFNWWDRMFGTFSEDYSTRFAEVTAHPSAKTPAS